MTLIYLAHRYGDPDPYQRRVNLESALSYLHAFRQDGLHVIAPWVALVQCEDERAREHGIATDLLILSRCDALVACGPEWSYGMVSEEYHARAAGLQIVDCVGMIHRVARGFLSQEVER